MWWYSTGWWWWWLLFLIVFFLLPLGYGWGYRGWGPWYRRRTPTSTDLGAEGTAPPDTEGWGWGASFLWIILLIAIVWLISAFVWRPAM
jgi:hypothetical protein